MEWNPTELAREFAATRPAGMKLDPGSISVVKSPAPHRQPKWLPLGRMAVITFSKDGETLFVGMCGPRCGPRFTSQPYNPGSAPSTLAGSLLRDPNFHGLNAAARADIKTWILSRTNRVDFLLPASAGREVLAALKGFLVARLNPRYGAGARHGLRRDQHRNARNARRAKTPTARMVTAPHMKSVANLATKSAKIRALLDLGYDRGAIASALGISYQHVYNVEHAPRPGAGGSGSRSGSGSPTKDVSRRHLDSIARLPTKAKKIRFLLDKGYSLAVVARAAGASYVYVSGFSRPGTDREPPITGSGSVAKRPVTSRHQKMIAKLPSKAAKIRSLLRKGYGRKAIANAVGTSYQHVYLVEHSGTPT